MIKLFLPPLPLTFKGTRRLRKSYVIYLKYLKDFSKKNWETRGITLRESLLKALKIPFQCKNQIQKRFPSCSTKTSLLFFAENSSVPANGIFAENAENHLHDRLGSTTIIVDLNYSLLRVNSSFSLKKFKSWLTLNFRYFT